MQVLPNTKPSPRLLDTAVTEVPPDSDAYGRAPRARLKGSGMLRGNGRAIFLGILLGALVISAAGFVFNHHHPVDGRFEAVRRFLVVRTHGITQKTVPHAADSLLKVQISPELLRVTAIALGHPRLAVVNGQEVAEGDSLTVKAYGGAVTVTLKVAKISEGKIELTDGTQIVTTTLPVASDGRRPAP